VHPIFPSFTPGHSGLAQNSLVMPLEKAQEPSECGRTSRQCGITGITFGPIRNAATLVQPLSLMKGIAATATDFTRFLVLSRRITLAARWENRK
jgi:hypothetical protein